MEKEPWTTAGKCSVMWDSGVSSCNGRSKLTGELQMQCSLLTLILAVCAVVGAKSFAATDVPTGAQAVLNLWPGVAPGSENWTRKETITPFVFAGRTVAVTRNVVTPTLTVFLPPDGKSTGVAAIIAPGGAFRHVTMDSEGYAPWMS